MSKYLVRFASSAETDSPGEAVDLICREFSDKGVRAWVYRVDDPDTLQTIGYYDGWGNEVNLDALTEVADALTEVVEAVSPSPTTQDSPEATDD